MKWRTLRFTRLADVVKARPTWSRNRTWTILPEKDQEAQAQVDTEKAAFGAAEQQLNVARANLKKTQTLFAYAQIRAPFDGVVTKRYADTGTMLAAGTSSEKQATPLDPAFAKR